jgi:hypothetical protein
VQSGRDAVSSEVKGMSKCSWWQRHDWIWIGLEKVTYPKRGPFDPRNDAERTYVVEMEVCSQCGIKQQFGINYGF